MPLKVSPTPAKHVVVVVVVGVGGQDIAEPRCKPWYRTQLGVVVKLHWG